MSELTSTFRVRFILTRSAVSVARQLQGDDSLPIPTKHLHLSFADFLELSVRACYLPEVHAMSNDKLHVFSCMHCQICNRASNSSIQKGN